MAYVRKDERTLGELFSDLSDQIQDMVRKEFLLARNEMASKVSRGAEDARSAAIGGVLMHTGALAVAAAVILLLGLIIPLWLSALLVGLGAAWFGYGLAQKGISDLKRIDITPHQTVSTLKENRQWLRRKAH
ncbi:MAG: phage holin family protein [Deltaproteobacteria bacterium]|nr:phage holin family protein [Deltaproteobacteria bacterium]MCL4874953.1 phage holin family protein [bacterium]